MRVLRFILMSLGLLFCAGITFAQTDRPYTGLDILFIVDQSNSMSGTAPALSATDPDGLRFQAVQYALNTLDDYRAVVPVGTEFRMSVIYFGNSAKTVLDWTTIGASPAWPDIKTSMSRLLSASSSESSGMGNTNFLDAFEMARGLFSRLPSPTSGQHLRVMVVLTDGAPCAPIRSEWSDKTCSTENDKTDHMDAVEDIARTSFSGSDFQIYVTAIDQTNTFYPIYKSNWEHIVGEASRAVQIESTDDIGPRFLSILAELTRRLRSSGEDSGSIIGKRIDFPGGTNFTTIGVPPYYQSMRLTVFRPSDSAAITLTKPDGTNVTSGSPGVTITTDLGDIEIWTITDPPPGTWSLSTSVDAQLIDIFLDLIRVETHFSFTPNGVLPPFSHVQFQFDVLGSNHLPLKTYTDARFALTVNATLTLPDGSVKTIPMSLTAPGSYTAFYAAEQAGLHTVSATATTLDLNSVVTTIAQVPDAGNFSVSTATLALTGFPTADLLVGDPITLTAQYRNTDGSMITTSGLDITMQMYESSGAVVVDFPMSQQADGSYTLTYRPDKEGQNRLVVQVKRDGVLLEEQRSSLFRVAPADLVLLQLVPQVVAMTHQATTGYPPQDNPLKLTLQTTLFESGSLFDLASLANRQAPFRLNLTRKSDNVDAATGISFTPVVGSTGLFQATFPKLETGDYTLQIRANEAILSPTNLRYHPTTLTLNATLLVEVDPSVALINTALVIALIIVVVIIIFWIIRTINLRKYPATGTLQVLEYDFSTDMKTPIKTINFKNFNSNHIVISGSKMPRTLNLKKIEIKAGTPNHARQKSIDISLYFTDGSPMQRTQLTPNYEYQIRADERSTLSIIKDPQSDDYY